MVLGGGGPTAPTEWYPTPLYNFWGPQISGDVEEMYGGWQQPSNVVAAYPQSSLRLAGNFLSMTWDGKFYDASLSTDPTAPIPVQVDLGFSPVGVFPITIGPSGSPSDPTNGAYLVGADGNLYLYVQQRVARSGAPLRAPLSSLQRGLNLVGQIPNSTPTWGGGLVISQAEAYGASTSVYASYVATKNGAVYKLTPSPTDLLNVAFDLVLLSPIAEATIISGVGVNG